MTLNLFIQNKIRLLDLTPIELSVLLSLIWLKDDDTGICKWSHVIIAYEAHCSIRQVCRATKSLREKGIVFWDVKATGRDVCEYVIVLGGRIIRAKYEPNDYMPCKVDYERQKKFYRANLALKSSGRNADLSCQVVMPICHAKLAHNNMILECSDDKDSKVVDSECALHTHTRAQGTTPTIDEVVKVGMEKMGLTEAYVRDWYQAMEVRGWMDKEGKPIRNWRWMLDAWHRQELRQQESSSSSSCASGVRRPIRSAQPDGVVLQQEGYDESRAYL